MTEPVQKATEHRVPFTTVFELALRANNLDFRVAMPATVIEYRPATSGEFGPLPAMVDVQPDLQAARPGREADAEDEIFKPVRGSTDGRGELVGDYPTFSVPVMYVGLAGLWGRGPLAKGEQGLLIFTDRALGRWLVAGRASDKTVDPGDGSIHGENLCDAFFLPGIRSGPKFSASSVPSEGHKLGPEDDSAFLHFLAEEMQVVTTRAKLLLDAATEILVGAGATSYIAKADKVTEKLNGIKNAISGAATAAGDGGATFKTNIMTALNLLDFDVAATKGKVE